MKLLTSLLSEARYLFMALCLATVEDVEPLANLDSGR